MKIYFNPKICVNFLNSLRIKAGLFHWRLFKRKKLTEQSLNNCETIVWLPSRKASWPRKLFLYGSLKLKV